MGIRLKISLEGMRLMQMNKSEIKKEDGRYLIYYTFDEENCEKSPVEGEALAEHNISQASLQNINKKREEQKCQS